MSLLMEELFGELGGHDHGWLLFVGNGFQTTSAESTYLTNFAGGNLRIQVAGNAYRFSDRRHLLSTVRLQ